jgi:hypothetical protein
MKTRFRTLIALALFFAILGAGTQGADAQTNKKQTAKPAPVIIKANAHAMHFSDFQVRRNRDRSLELEIKRKGLDVAFTEWMQRDHPYVFATVCSKQIGQIATEFKSTPHMSDFETLLGKRSDLRLKAEKYGHDVAFAEWLRTERPDTYRQHFGLGADNKPLKKKPGAK